MIDKIFNNLISIIFCALLWIMIWIGFGQQIFACIILFFLFTSIGFFLEQKKESKEWEAKLDRRIFIIWFYSPIGIPLLLGYKLMRCMK